MRLIAHAAPAASCLHASGNIRSIANKVAFGECTAEATLVARARSVMLSDVSAGKVHTLGTLREPKIHAQLGASLGALLMPALRPDLEWYQCRGAFFHNDAHYDARLFGIWCIVGPPARARLSRGRRCVWLRGPGSIAVFDPFEVHGILAPQCAAYVADDYEDAEASIFLGFELDITPAIAAAFGIKPGAEGRVISTRTRIAADTGAFDSD